MKKGKIKSNKKEMYSSQEMRHYLGALSEMQVEQLKGIKEGFQVMNRKLDKYDEKFGSINKKLDSHTEMIGVLMEDVSIIKHELKRKVDYDEFLSLVKRVQKIEAKV